MNRLTTKLLIFLLLSNSAVHSINAMNQETALAKEMSNEMVMRSIQQLPQDLKRYIIALVLQSDLKYKFSFFKKIDVKYPVYAVAWSPNGETILTGSANKRACIWSSKTGELLTTLKRHRTGITSVAFSPDGETIFTGSYDTTACLWNSKTRELITTLKGHRG